MQFLQNDHLTERKINTEFNISFNKPQKDSCDLRAQFVNADETEKRLLVTEYEIHLINKNKISF